MPDEPAMMSWLSFHTKPVPTGVVAFASVMNAPFAASRCRSEASARPTNANVHATPANPVYSPASSPLTAVGNVDAR